MSAMNWNPAELLKLSGSYWSTCALHAGGKLGGLPLELPNGAGILAARKI